VENILQKSSSKNTHNTKNVERLVKKLLLITHKRPHLDEILAILIYVLWTLWKADEKSTETFLKVIEVVEFMFVNSGEKFNVPQNAVAFGTGKGLYDEHRPYFNGRYFNSDRIPGQCSATLVAEYTEQYEYFQTVIEKLKEILEYVLLHDSKGYRNAMDVADTVNSLKHCETDKDLMKLGMKILYSLYRVDSLPTQEERDKMIEFIESWLKGKDETIAGQIIRFAKGLKHGNRVPFDLTQIYFSSKTTYNEGEAIRIIKKLLDCKYYSQQKFFEAVEELKEKGKTDLIPTGKKILKMITVKSGNFQIPKAARNRKHGPGATWLNMKTMDKKFLTFHDKSFDFTKEIRNIIAALRLEEQLIRKIKNPLVDFKQLSRAGSLNIPGVGDIWYLQTEERGGKIFNGTETRNVEETKIHLGKIRDIIRTILMLEENFKWEVWVLKRLKK
jgi:hypothetical protein